MPYEAISSGLRMAPFTKSWVEPEFKESLTGVWKALEYIPFRRLTYKDEESTTRRRVAYLSIKNTNSMMTLFIIGLTEGNPVKCSAAS